MNTYKGLKMRLIRLLTLLSLAMAATVAGGCAEPVEDINTVQPDYFDKALFEGEWYYRQTMVGVSPEVMAGFVGMEADIERIQWEITDDFLYARRVHEAIPGLDEDRTREGSEYQGDILAMFGITKHFDIKREYNAATGEESNIVGENTSDRHWRERRYIRVDWAGISLSGPQDVDWWGIRMWDTSSDYIRPYEHFDPDALIADQEYIQVTKRMTVETSRMCYFAYGDWSGCSSADVRLRHAFFPVPHEAQQQHEPRIYDDIQQIEGPDGKPVRTLFLPVTRFGGPGTGSGGACNAATDCGTRLGCVDSICTSCSQNADCGPGESCVPSAEQDTGECSTAWVELACTDELMEYLDGVYAPGFFTVEDDCDIATYRQEERHGFFRTETHKYDRRIGGGHDSQREFKANIHNIWQAAYETTTDADGKEVVKLDDAGNKVLIPMAERRLQPIVYYLSPAFPEDLTTANIEIAGDWNKAFMDVAVAATGRSREEIADQLEADYGDEDALFLPGDEVGHRAMYQIRQNTCSVAGITPYVARNPDLHDVVAQATGATVEDVAIGDLGLQRGNLLRVCAGLRAFSRERGAERFDWQQIGDPRNSLLYWVNEVQAVGPLGYGPSSVDAETAQIVSGNAYIYGASLDRSAARAADIVQFMNDDLDLDTLLTGDSYLAWLDTPTTVAETSGGLSAETSELLRARLFDANPEMANGEFSAQFGPKRFMQEHREMRAAAKVQERGSVLLSEGREKLRALRDDPRFAGKLMVPEHMDLLAPLYDWEPGKPVPEAMAEAAFDMSTDRDAFSERMQERADFFADRNVFMAEAIDDAVIGKALSMKGLPREEVYATLRAEIYRAVTLHEIGHTVGLTHNFEASFDPLNYQDEYWEIRATNPESEWANERMHEYQYASIMDYHGRFHADAQGLGKYDEAAVKFAYAKTTEVFDPDVDVAVTPDLGLYTNFVYGGQSLPSLLGGDYHNLSKRVDVPIEDVVEERGRGMLRNTASFIEAQTALNIGGERKIPEYYSSREVPYAYCEHRYLFRARCKQYDLGGSHTEVVKNAISNYWNYYVFNAYRRGRSENGFIRSYLGRQARIADDLTYALRYWYYQSLRSNPSRIASDYLEATLLGINFINQVLGTPAPGRHCLDADTNTYLPADSLGPDAECDELLVAPGTGRDQFLRHSDEYYTTIDYIGTFYDKTQFLFYLMDDSTRFFNITDLGDSRRFSINYYRLFRPELVKLVRDLLFSYFEEGDNDTFSSVVAPGGDVRPPLLIDPARYGLGENNTEGMARIRTPVPYNLLWLSLLYSTALNTTTGDDQFDFVEYVTVIEEGSGEDRDLLEGRRTARFEHPTTGAIYYAPQTFDELSISYEYLEFVNRFVDEQWRPAREAAKADGASAADLDAAAAADLKLGELTDLMNDLRFLRSAVR